MKSQVLSVLLALLVLYMGMNEYFRDVNFSLYIWVSAIIAFCWFTYIGFYANKKQ